MDIPYQYKKIVIFGAGYWGNRVFQRGGLRLDFFVDNDPGKQGSYVGAFPIYPVERLSQIDKDEYFIIVANEKHAAEIETQLEGLGFVKGLHYADFRELFVEMKEQLEGVPHRDAPRSPIRQLRYNVTYRCNSRCKMCNCWQNTDAELSPEQFAKVLSDPFLSEVQSLYITGGEPFILKDFPEYIYRAVETLPNLGWILITTNGLMPHKIVPTFLEMRDYCSAHKVVLEMSVSLDGTEKVNDEQRGVVGGYHRALSVIEQLRTYGIECVVSATITKINAWNLEEFLSFLHKRNLQVVFKVGLKNGFFKNFDCDVLDFDEVELYQIELFLYKLLHEPIQNEWLDAVCINSIKALEENQKERLLGCGYQDGTAMAIMQSGNFKYCSCVSEEVEIQENDSLRAQYINHFQYFDFLKNAVCPICIADTFAYKGAGINDYQRKMDYWQNFFTLNFFYQFNHFEKMMHHIGQKFCLNPKGSYILITGWYGTETVGDKAILGELLHTYKAAFPDAQLQVTSLYPFITKRTLKELAFEAEVVPLYGKESLAAAYNASMVVMGGGPLMELESLAIPLWLFKIAKHAGKRAVVNGCGIGPLKSERMKEAVREILRMADEVTLRDAASCKWALTEAGVEAVLTDDPVIGYLRRIYPPQKRAYGGNKILACFLREITEEYNPCSTREGFLEWRRALEAGLAENIRRYCIKYGLTPHFYAMHNFVVGGDDRDFNYRFADEYFKDMEHWVDNRLTDIDKVADVMCQSGMVLCMRYHSAVFADTLGANYIPVDYTSGGKVDAFVRSRGMVPLSASEITRDPDALIGFRNKSN